MLALVIVLGIILIVVGVAVLLGPEGLMRARQATWAVFIGLALVGAALIRIFVYATSA